MHQPATPENIAPAQPATPAEPIIPPKPAEKNKPKDLRFNTALKKSSSPGLNTAFQFDVMAQLANIPARITLHELFRLSRETREALKEALTQLESFLTQLTPQLTESGDGEPLCSHSNMAMQHVPSITFTDEDMLLKDNNHDRPLYHTGYIGSSRIERIQVDLGSALSIIPRRVMNFMRIPLCRLASITTTIYGFNSGSSRPLGKIRLKCQISDLRSEITCYVIDAETSYNMLVGRPWIHANWIVPSTLYQCFKYVDDRDCTVKTVFADTHPFKGVENYFTDSLLYEDSHQAAGETTPEGPGDGNEADVEDNSPDDDIVAYFNDSACKEFTVDSDDEWVINENAILGYSLYYDSIYSSEILQSLHLPVLSSTKAPSYIEDGFDAVFKVPPTKKDQAPIIFGKVPPRDLLPVHSDDELPPPPRNSPIILQLLATL